MRFPQRITHTSMTRRKHPVPLPPHLRPIQFQLHQLVHILQHQHVAVQLHDAGVLGEGERGQLRPAVVEARVVAVVLPLGGEEVLDALLGDAPSVQGGVAFRWEGVCVQGHERIGGPCPLEGVV